MTDTPEPLTRHQRLRAEVERAHAVTPEQWPWFTPSTVGGLLNDIDAKDAEIARLREELEARDGNR